MTVGNVLDLVNAPDTSSIAALLSDPGDDGLSLREVILAANADPSSEAVSIDFASGANEAFENGGTIVLTNGELGITSEVSIDGDVDGDGSPDVTINGNDSSRIFNVKNDSPLTSLNGLILTQGNHGTEGGAIRVNKSAAKISNSVIEGNVAGSFGGGIVAIQSQVEIVSSTIRKNEAGRSGGGLELFRGTTTIVSSTISGNESVQDGGGVFSQVNNSLIITNSTVAGNTATSGFGGGVAALGSSLDLVNVTVTGNSANIGGGGLVAGTTETVQNTIIVGNSSTTGEQEVWGSVDTTTNSIVSGAVADIFDEVDADTGGGLLADNGGTVQTVMLKADPANPALDLGDLPTGLLFDARGESREIDLLDLTNGGTVDAGAVELIGDVNGLRVDTTSMAIDPFDGVTSLREAIAYANSTTAGPNGDGDADGDGSSNDTITFASGVGEAFENGGSITHSGSSRLLLTSDITINGDVDGDGEHDVTITGSGRVTRLMHISAGHAQLHGLQFDNGRASYFQGGDEVGAIQLDAGAELTLTSSLISRSYSPVGAAAIRNAGTATVINSEFTGGQGYINAGGVNNTGGIHNLAGATLTMSDSTFRSNLTNIFYTASTGLLLNDGTAYLSNVTFQNNRGFKGGAFQNRSGGVATLANVTITGSEATGANTDAPQPAGGITNEAGATLTLTNSIVLGNQGREDKDVYNAGTLNLVGGNIIGEEFSVDGVVQQTGMTPEDVFADTTIIQGAEAGVFADNGGLVQTVALKSGLLNPAIDAGDDLEASAADARGESRADHAQIGNRDSNASDLGAYELSPGSLMISSFGGVARASIAVAENTTTVVDLSVVDDVDTEGSGIGYSISGGADSALFNVDATTGQVTFISAADFEVPTDANLNGVYEVEVRAADSDGHTATQVIEVTVTDAAENFVVDSIGSDDDGNYSSGELTLREAINLANIGLTSVDTITFASGTGEAFENGGSITHSGARLLLASDMTINGDVDGDGDHDIKVTGSNRSTRLMHISAGHAQLHGLQLDNARANYFQGGDEVGAIQLDAGAELTLTSSLISGAYSPVGAAAIRNAGTATISNSEFTGGQGYVNSGGFDNTAGIHNMAGATLTMTDSTFRENLSIIFYAAGDGVLLNDGVAYLTNVTFQKSRAFMGGAFHNRSGGVASLTNVTITGSEATGANSADSQPAGGITNEAGATLTLKNSIVLGNQGREDKDLYNAGTLNLVGGNIVGEEFSVDGVVQQTGITPEDVFADTTVILEAEAGGIADNGGPVQTVALKSGLLNQALDSGDDAEAAALDARGESRADHALIANRDGNTSDLGAFELPAGAPMFSSFGGVARASVEIVEGSTAVTDLSVLDDTDSEGAGLTYSISGGADGAFFSVDTTTGEVTFISSPDFENPLDANGNNVYEVEVQATDIDGNRATQIVEVTVTDIAETFVVDNSGDEDDGDYSAGEFTLREAVKLTNFGPESVDTITFADGTGEAFENQATIRLVGGQIEISSSVDIQGDGKVFITADANADDVVLTNGQTDVDATLASDGALSDGIDNDNDGLIDDADTDGETLLDDNSRIFDLTNPDAINYMSGLTLTGGSTNAFSEEGGAIRHISSLYLYDSIISGNSTRGAASEGGGVASPYVDIDGPFGALKMVGSTVDNNRTINRSSGGGGISSFAGAVYIKDSSVSGNASTGYGGGVKAFYGPTTIIQNSQINHNTASTERGKGGGLWSYNAEITDSQFIGNRTLGDRGDGGGIVAINSLTIDNSIIDDNHTYGVRSDGGGIYMEYANDGLRITNSTITNNTTAGVQSSGGGVYVDRGNATITNTTISGNTTTGQWATGGGVHVGRGNIMLENSTVTNNATEGYGARGGGVRSDSMTVRNSVISGNRTLGDESEGGGIAAVRSFSIFDSTVRDNHTYGSEAFGGGISVFGSLSLNNSEISGNTTSGNAAGGGGAFATREFNSTNSTVANNHTYGDESNGGGVWVRESSTVLTTTLTGNGTHGADADGGGIFLSGTSWAKHFVTLQNSILSGNVTSHASVNSDEFDPGQWGNDLNLTAGNIVADEFSVDGAVVQANLTAEEVFATVVNNHGVDAGELADNGGSFYTVALKSALVNPALDSGDDTLAPDADIRGEARADHAQIINRDGNISDLGSFELPAGSLMFSSFAGVARASIDVNEGTTTVTDLSVVDDIDSEGSGVTYSISGGADSLLFNVDASTGVLNFAAIPDFELPLDADGDNLYVVEVEAIDSDGYLATQIVEVNVVDLVETYVVDNIGDIDDGNYATGELTLREAVALANAGAVSADTITFAAETGEAFENGATIRLIGGELEITSPVAIQGDGNVTITADADANDVVLVGGITDVDATLASTAADSDGIDNDDDGLIDDADTDGENLLDDNSRIFHISNADATTTLSALILTGGRTTADGDTAWGGAILHEAPLYLADSTVNGNSTSGHYARGGALAGAYYSYAPLTVVNSTLDNNRSGSAGGAIMNFSGDVYIEDSSISGNIANGQGGGMNAFFGDSTIIKNTQFNNNRTTAARGSGGGLWAEFATISDSEFIGNRTEGDEAEGGGLSVGRALTLTNTVVTDNHTTGRLSPGGGIYMGQMINGARVENSIISNNSTAGDLSGGGGIYIDERDTYIINTPITLNKTTGNGSPGGGIRHHGVGGLYVRDSALTGNRTEGDGSGGGAIEANLHHFQNITVTDNQTWGLQASGGGLDVGTGTILGSNISNNQTRGYRALGGGIDAFRLNLVGSVVSGNSTLGDQASGGGVFSSHTTVNNSTIAGNSTSGADAMGGGHFSRWATTFTNATVTGNSTHGANAIGGGIYHWGSSAIERPLSLANSIVLGNTTTSTTGSEETGFGEDSIGLALTGGNIVGDEFTLDAATGQTGVTADAVFAAIADNNGVDAGFLDDNGGDLPSVALLAAASNPAINNGDNDLQDQTLDVRGTGFDRVKAGTIDLGAFEIQNDAPVITSDGGGETATLSVVENSTAVTNLESTDDSDAENSGLIYTLTELNGGGAENAMFTLDSTTGELTFTTPPDYEDALDSDGDNIYEVQVTVTDSAGGQDTQSISVEVTNAPLLEVESVEVNDGEAQRSMVRSIAVTFNRDDVVVDASTFEVINTATGQAVALSVDTTTEAGRTVARILFTGTGVAAGSLVDGTYQLRIKAAAVQSAAEMDNDHVDEFFRKFGDSNGDGIVNSIDFLAFRRTYRRTSGNALFDESFDSDGDGDVDATDYLAFRRNYLR
ncbi:MAG: choice-of-anchor Q domain-containing protein [Aureliella sp.]